MLPLLPRRDHRLWDALSPKQEWLEQIKAIIFSIGIVPTKPHEHDRCLGAGVLAHARNRSSFKPQKAMNPLTAASLLFTLAGAYGTISAGVMAKFCFFMAVFSLAGDTTYSIMGRKQPVGCLRLFGRWWYWIGWRFNRRWDKRDNQSHVFSSGSYARISTVAASAGTCSWTATFISARASRKDCK